MIAGEEHSFRSLVEAHYKGLYRFAHSLCRNEHQACDLTQQTFVAYAEKGSALRDPAKAKSWLFTTLHREFLRQYRRDRRSESRDPCLLEEIVPDSSPPAIDGLDHRRVIAALHSVEDTYREPLVLFFLRDFSYREIAEILDLPIGTVMSRLSRGKAKLKTVFLESPDLSES
ncbi:MAG: RNA polymerase sigma factor [Puniceicoccaceae bacterium]